MDFHDHEYVHATGMTRAIPDGETEYAHVDYDPQLGWVLHQSEVWARAEQALLQEQRDAQIAKEKEERLERLIDTTLAVHIPYRICAQIPGWRGSLVVRNDIIYMLRKEGYL